MAVMQYNIMILLPRCHDKNPNQKTISRATHILFVCQLSVQFIWHVTSKQFIRFDSIAFFNLFFRHLENMIHLVFFVKTVKRRKFEVVFELGCKSIVQFVIVREGSL